MLDHEHGDAEFVPYVQNEAGDVLRLLLVHAGDHFVQQQQFRLAGERAGKLHALLLAVGQMADHGIANMLDLEKLDDLLDLFARRDFFIPRTTEKERGFEHTRSGMHVAADENVLDHRAVLEQRQVLEGAADAQAREIRRPFTRDVGAVKNDAAARRPQHAADEIEQRCLAGAIGADDAADLAARHVEADVGHGAQATEGAGQRFDLEKRAHDSHLLRRL